MGPSAHVFDDLGPDLALSQIQRENGLPPGFVEPLHVELGQLQEVARAAGGDRHLVVGVGDAAGAFGPSR